MDGRVLSGGLLRVPLLLRHSDDQAAGGVWRWAGGGETLWSQEHLPSMVRAPGLLLHGQAGHDVGVVGEGRHLRICDWRLMSAKGAQDESRSFSDVQDLDETLGANSVQTVQDFRLAFVGIVVLVADFTFYFLRWGAVLLDVSLCTSHLQVMFWGGK